MKLVFVKPKSDRMYPFVHEHLFHGLWTDGIYIGKRDQKEFDITWNSVYNFWNITLFPIPGNRGNPTQQYEKFEEWLKENKYKYKVWKNGSWKWENHVCIYGINFWVYPKDI